jgi:hypothetical protein
MTVRWKAWTTVGLVTVTATLLTLSVTGSFESAPSAKPQSVGEMARLMIKGAKGAYVATYEISNYAYFSAGSLVVANIPPVTGTKVRPNLDGFSSTLESSYVFRGTNGRIVQWIQKKTNVSACSNGPFVSGTRKLECSRPFAYIPSNGFVEEGLGLLPANMVNDFDGVSYHESIFSKSSKRFGELQCLRQWQTVGSFQSITCINRSGLTVSWTTRKGAKLLGHAQLTALSDHPTQKNFTTLVKPTRAVILPGY